MYRWVVVVASTALVVSGCSTNKPAAPAPAPAASKPASSVASPAPQTGSSDTAEGDVTRLSGSECVEVTQANLDLATAMNATDARKAGDAFEKYDLPASVKEAVEHFVGTGGAQFDDPSYDKYNGAIEHWVKQVCPL